MCSVSEQERARLNKEIQKVVETDHKGALALPAINWIDLISKLLPILIQVLQKTPTPTPAPTGESHA